MLTIHRHHGGVTLIELIIGLAIFSTLLAMAAPSFGDWMQNLQLRNAAEMMQNGLQLARAEAVKRNTQVAFSLTTTANDSCAISSSGTSWVISIGDPATDLPGKCGTTPTPDDPDADPPRIIQVRSGSESSRNAVINANQSVVVFNGMGRLGSFSAGTPTAVEVNVTNPEGGNCVADGGGMRCLRVVVSLAGQIRMCDPHRASTDAQGC